MQFDGDVGYGLHAYQWCLAIGKDGDSSVKFVYLKRVYSPEYIAALATYCRCMRCSSWIMGKFMCPCCVGCLHAGTGYASEFEVKNATRLHTLQLNTNNEIHCAILALLSFTTHIRNVINLQISYVRQCFTESK